MKRILYLTFIVVIFLISNSTAQRKDAKFTQSLRGIITDLNSGLPIPGVTVTLKLSSQSTTTNASGVFILSGIPVGRQTLQISSIGYQTTLSEVLVTSGKEAEVTVAIESVNQQLTEVAINITSGRKPLNLMAMSSGRSFSPEETNRYAGAMFDPARMAQSFAGVVAGGDNNEIIVRGNSPKSLQWRLEGVEITNPNHFGGQGGSGGAISMLNSTVLSTSDFYTGAMPAEYSNATSGVFDLKFRKGNANKREYAFTAGVLGLGATVEGPIKKGSDASYLISYRYSALDLLQKVVKVSDFGVPRYQDLSFNVVVPSQKFGTFSLFGIGGSGGLKSDAEHDFSKWEERTDAYNSDNTYGAASAGLKHVYSFNSHLYMNNIVSYSGDRSKMRVDTLTRTYQASKIQQNHYDNGAFRYAGTLNYLTSESNTIRAGVNTSELTYNLYEEQYKKEQDRLVNVLNEKGHASTFDAYIENKHQFGGGFSINTGVHANYFDLSDSWSVEPRIGMNLQVTQRQKLSLAGGTYSRLEPLSYYFAKGENASRPASKPLEPTKSAQLVMGYENQLSNKLKFKSEIYYQHLSNVPVANDPSNNFSLLNVSDNSAILATDYTTLVNKGTGKNYGLELSLEKSMDKGYYFMISSSLFDSKFKALSGLEFNTTFNTHYVGNLVIGKEWATGEQHKNMFALNGKIIYAGGRRYSPILLEESLRLDEQVIDQSKTNTLTADAYIRADFSASYRINRKKSSHYIILDIQNLLNRENNLGTYYNPSKRAIEANKWIGIFPTINYRIEL